MTMIERVARAIYEEMDVMDGLDLAAAAERYARAAIEAMWEPTPEMTKAGHLRGDPYASGTWPIMIDAALAESKEG